MSWRGHIRRTAGGVLIAVVLSVALAGKASAGTYQVVLGANAGDCDASSYFGPGFVGTAECASGGPGWYLTTDGSQIGAGVTGQWQVSAPSGLAIVSATIPNAVATGIVSSNQNGWQAASFWDSGANIWRPNAFAHGPTNVVDSGIWSDTYGVKLYCYAASCPQGGGPTLSPGVYVPQIDLTVAEGRGPSLVAVGSSNLWYQASDYVWNPSGDPFSVEMTSSDPSGVCDMFIEAGGQTIYGPSATASPTVGFTQCPATIDFAPSAGAEVDTSLLVSPGTSGSFPLVLQATNAAGVATSDSETINVDNITPSVSLAATDDSDPGGWTVNHTVTVTAAAHTGPSGLASLACSVDGAAAKTYPAAGVAVNGNGQHTITCTAANGAVGPQRQPNSGTAAMSVDIDEQTPSLSIEPQDPSDPAQVVVNTSDSESQVAGGQIEIAPQGTSSWTSVPTTLTSGGQLIATIPDAGLSGPYTIQATACSQVGNCGSTSEALTMPLRLAPSSEVSFATIVNPLVAKKVKERVRVGWHWVAMRRHGRAVKVKRGGHWKTITVVKRVEQCTRKRVRTGKHHWKLITRCRAPKIRLKSTERAGYGHSVTVHGLLVTSQDVPLVDTPVTILTAPNNGLGQYTPAASVTTGADGAWSATLPAGPSRVIEAVYGGSGTLLPATGQATVTVPARITLSVRPREVPWTKAVALTGRLLGGYVPSDGVPLRLMIGYPNGPRGGSNLASFRTDSAGRFRVRWNWHGGRGVVSYRMWISFIGSAENDYPFTAASSKHRRVTFGRAAPRRHQQHQHRRRKASHRKKRHRATAHGHKHRRKR